MKLLIIGTGKMAEAIVEGVYKDIDVEVAGRDKKKLEYFKNKFGVSVKLLDSLNIEDKKVLLAVKPFALRDVSLKLNGEAEILISILAGV